MTSDLVRFGKAVGSSARAAMVNVLFDGTAHTAGELARAAGVSSATASQHLGILVDAGIANCQALGRNRYYAMANAQIAHALEQLSGSSQQASVSSLRMSREQRRVRVARTCYDHLAGQLGVELAERFVVAGWIDVAFSTITDTGRVAFLERFGADTSSLTTARRPEIRGCMDWTERRLHMAGSAGAVLASSLLDKRWVLRKPNSRGLTITRLGYLSLDELGVRLSETRD